MILSLSELLEMAAWMRALPGRETAERNEVLRAFQPCPLSGKPDIEPTSPNDRVCPSADIEDNYGAGEVSGLPFSTT